MDAGGDRSGRSRQCEVEHLGHGLRRHLLESGQLGLTCLRHGKLVHGSYPGREPPAPKQLDLRMKSCRCHQASIPAANRPAPRSGASSRCSATVTDARLSIGSSTPSRLGSMRFHECAIEPPTTRQPGSNVRSHGTKNSPSACPSSSNAQHPELWPALARDATSSTSTCSSGGDAYRARSPLLEIACSTGAPRNGSS